MRSIQIFTFNRIYTAVQVFNVHIEKTFKKI